MNCYPSEFDSVEQWYVELDKMILAFKLMQEMGEDIDIQFDENTQDLVKEGLETFAKYYMGLWW